jgi:hypothetical protein
VASLGIFAVALAEAAVVDREHGEAEASELGDAVQLSGEIPAHAVEVVHHGCTGSSAGHHQA